MRKIALVVVLLAACGRKDPGLTIVIPADGFVKFEGKAVTLDELGTLLAARRDAAPLEEVGPWGIKASSLPVRLELDDGTAWGHIAWVMVVLAEQKIWRLSFPGGWYQPLPTDGGGTICRAPDGAALLVRVLVREDGEYAFGSRTTRDIDEVGAWIDEVRGEGVLCRISVIRVQPRASWRSLRPVLDALRARGRIEFYGSEIPPLDERGRSPLSPPRSAREPMLWGGPAVVEYWEHEGSWGEEPSLEADLLALVRGHRLGLGLPLLGGADALAEAARLHANEMDRMGYFGHFSPVPGSRSPNDRLAKLGWPEERRHAELLAKADDAEAALAAILKNPESTKILADPAFTFAGVAVSGDCWVVLLGAEP